VTAVNHPALSEWYDVIIFSTKGDRSLASLLGGGGESDMVFTL
jgi:RNA-dependent RNA polymerase